MKFLISVLLMALLSFATCLYLPWWSIGIACFVVAVLIPQRPLMAFLAGFFALFFLWGGLSLWISSNNENLLASKISILLLQADNPVMLILATALIGALVGGFASLTGSFLRNRKGVI